MALRLGAAPRFTLGGVMLAVETIDAEQEVPPLPRLQDLNLPLGNLSAAPHRRCPLVAQNDKTSYPQPSAEAEVNEGCPRGPRRRAGAVTSQIMSMGASPGPVGQGELHPISRRALSSGPESGRSKTGGLDGGEVGRV